MSNSTIQVSDGSRVPTLGLGVCGSSPQAVKDAVMNAVEMGQRHIDCVFVNGNEEAVGDALIELFKRKVVRREDLSITAKLWNTIPGFGLVKPALKETLRMLKIDYIDLYLMHKPLGCKIDKRPTLSPTANARTSRETTSKVSERLAQIPSDEEDDLSHFDLIALQNYCVKMEDKISGLESKIAELDRVDLPSGLPKLLVDRIIDYRCRLKRIEMENDMLDAEVAAIEAKEVEVEKVQNCMDGMAITKTSKMDETQLASSNVQLKSISNVTSSDGSLRKGAYVDFSEFDTNFKIILEEHKNSRDDLPTKDQDYLDIWKAMEEVKNLGLAKSIGLSNFSKEQIQKIIDNCDIYPAIILIDYSINSPDQHQLISYCETRGIRVVTRNTNMMS